MPYGNFFFNDTATTEIYTLSLHDALPICQPGEGPGVLPGTEQHELGRRARSEEHTSELQSQSNLVCRLLLEKKNIASVCPSRASPARPPHPALSQWRPVHSHAPLSTSDTR